MDERWTEKLTPLPELEAHVYTDGASTGSRGLGGYGAVIYWEGKTEEISGGEQDTTNLRMELTAACVALAYTEDSKWRNRDEFFEGREAIRDFLKRKWARELDYRLEKNLWCFTENRIAVRFEYESHDKDGQWWRSHLYDRFATPPRPPSAGSPRARVHEAIAS